MSPSERTMVRELLDAEEAYRAAPTLGNTSRLYRARRELEQRLMELARSDN
jgi:hypothetical protein